MLLPLMLLPLMLLPLLLLTLHTINAIPNATQLL
jgi:hypothetical protein